MLIKKKKKKYVANKLEGIKFTHEITDLIYTISKKSNETLFKVSWEGKGANITGSILYSREDITRNIEKGVWKVVF